ALCARTVRRGVPEGERGVPPLRAARAGAARAAARARAGGPLGAPAREAPLVRVTAGRDHARAPASPRCRRRRRTPGQAAVVGSRVALVPGGRAGATARGRPRARAATLPRARREARRRGVAGAPGG